MTWRVEGAACWDEEQAHRIIPIEAEELPDHIFASTHVPLDLRPVEPATLTSVGSKVGESDVLDRIRRARGTDIIPILGASGAGKSHLVRWLRGELSREPIPDSTVVFIPKHRTSLYGVVGRVLDAFEGEAFVSGFRERLKTAQDKTSSDAVLRTRLRDEIALGLQHRSEVTEAKTEEDQHYRNWLAGELPKLLRDPHFEGTYLGESAALARLVEEKRHGRAGDDAVESAFQFTPSDVSISVEDASRASADAQQVANHLAGESSEDPATVGPSLSMAVRMINDQLPIALKAVFGIGGEDLKELFFDIRQTLHGRSRVILLVEDFSMFQGLQGGLLDAITLHSTEESRPKDAAPLCDLTTVVAVTTQYFEAHIPDTVKTRSRVAYEVSRSQEATTDRFVTTYLRAIRAGEVELKAAFQQGRAVDSVCGGCTVQERCHDQEAFGAVEGEGLYPFNSTSLSRALEHVTPYGFNARETLNQVLLPVLTEDRDAIQERRFPTTAFANRFGADAIPIDVSDAAHLRRAGEGDRRIALATLYAHTPSRADLAPAIHDAFSLPRLGLTAIEDDGDDDDEEDEGQGQRKPGPKIPDLVAAINRWPQQGLSSTSRRDIRKLVHQAVIARLPFEDGACKAGVWTSSQDSRKGMLSPCFVPSDVVIDEHQLTRGGDVRLDVSRNDNDVVEVIQTLAWLDAGGDILRSIPDITERLGRANTIIDRWAQDIAAQLGAWAPVDDDLTQLVRCLDLAAAYLGRRTMTASLEDRIEAMFETGDPRGRTHDPGGYTEKIDQDAHAIRDLLIRRTTFAQGTGKPSLVNLPMLRTALRRTRPVDPEVLAAPVRVATKRIVELGRKLDQLRDEQAKTLPDLDILGPDDPTDIARELVEALRKAPVETVLAADVHDAADAIAPNAVQVVAQTRERFNGWDELSAHERAALVGGTWHVAADQVATFIATTLEVLQKAAPRDHENLGKDQAALIAQEWRQALLDIESMLEGR